MAQSRPTDSTSVILWLVIFLAGSAFFEFGSVKGANAAETVTVDDCIGGPQGPYDTTIFTPFPDGGGGIEIAQVVLYFGGCENVTYMDFNDTPDLPTGNTLQLTEDEAEAQIRAIILQDILQEIKGKVQNSIINQHYNPTPNIIRILNSPCACVRGSLDTSGGFSLSTGTPGYNSFGNDSLNVATNVPFIVDSAAPGDSLSIYGPTGLIWSQPLSSFTPGQLYFAQIPPQTTAASEAVAITYWIHGADQGTSSVYFPAQIVVVDGDLNGDGVVNCADLAIVKASFGKKTNQSGFNPVADLNGDGVVNILDLSAEARFMPVGTVCQ